MYPLLDENPAERQWIHEHALPLRDDILHAFGDLLALYRRHVVPNGARERLAARCFAQIIHAPWRPQGRWLAAAQHRENFGVFNATRFRDCGEAPTLAERLRFLATLASRPRRVIEGSFWPAETIHRHLGRVPTVLYGLYRRTRVGL